MSSISTSVFSIDAFEDNNSLNSIIQQVTLLLYCFSYSI
jgi:hypothetical protein